MDAIDSVREAREAIAEEIRVMLARRKMNASELARRMGVTQPYISRRLTGDIALDVDDLVRIAAVLGMEIAEFFPRAGRVVVTGGARRSGRQVTPAIDPPANLDPKWDEPGPEIKPWKSRLAERPGPNGHPKRTSPDPATRRPARVSAALSH